MVAIPGNAGDNGNKRAFLISKDKIACLITSVTEAAKLTCIHMQKKENRDIVPFVFLMKTDEQCISIDMGDFPATAEERLTYMFNFGVEAYHNTPGVLNFCSIMFLGWAYEVKAPEEITCSPSEHKDRYEVLSVLCSTIDGNIVVGHIKTGRKDGVGEYKFGEAEFTASSKENAPLVSSFWAGYSKAWLEKHPLP